MIEEAEVFGRGHRLVGLSSRPADGDPRAYPAVLLTNAGLIHRIGPRRLYVALARRLAAEGRLVLRFDLSGIGDSESRRDGLPVVQGVVQDTVEAMDHLTERFGVERFVLIGICSGAKVSFKVASGDERVTGVVLVDPGDFGFEQETSLVAADPSVVQHYARHYVRMIRSKPLTLRRLAGWATGRANYGYAWRMLKAQLSGMGSGRRSIRASRAEILGVLDALAARECRALFVFTDESPSLDFYTMTLERALAAREGAANVAVDVLRGADHDFSSVSSQRQLLDRVVAWELGHGRPARSLNGSD